MKTLMSIGPSGRVALGFIGLALVLPSPRVRAVDLPPVEKPTVNAPVTITDQGATWTMDNGIIRAIINKGNSHITQMFYHNVQMMGPGGIWEQVPHGQVKTAITIDPAKNGGDRGEVDMKGVSSPMDIEVRYCLERGSSGIYTYAEFSHPASYPRAGEGESRFICQLNGVFDWLTVDADRNMLMIAGADQRGATVIHAKEQSIIATGNYKNSVEQKYSYCGVMYRQPAYGWSDTKDHIGFWFINPTTEYIGGGAEKLDLDCHMGATILDYWTSGHYAGGAGCNIPAGENWNKVIGPIFVYCNALPAPLTASAADLATLQATQGNPTLPPAWKANATALWQDAMGRARVETARWPYDWVSGVDYTPKAQRANITGQLVLDDPQAASSKLPNLTVGLSHPDYTSGAGGFVSRSGNGNIVTWAHDGNYYQFWTNGTEDGKFDITNVRPGAYTLHAFADGVLGEFAKTNITVEPGKDIDLGKLTWQPERYGKQVWEIGYPDRTGDKFYKGDAANYWLWGWPLRYADLFPNDITYTIGKSDYHKDWFFEEVPHALSDAWQNPAAKDPLNQPFGWVQIPPPGQDMWNQWGMGRSTTWTVKFNMDKAETGQAVMRIALAGSDSTAGLSNPGAMGKFDVGVNGKNVGTVQIISTNAIRYNTNKGVWRQYAQPFDASLLKQGENSVTFTVPAGEVTSGVVWDYLRLELNESATPGSALAPLR